ncbi:hypothetical protein EON67_04960, partial [archaeon]
MSSWRSGERVVAAWLDGTPHAAEIVEERTRNGAKEYYVHYINCTSCAEQFYPCCRGSCRRGGSPARHPTSRCLGGVVFLVRLACVCVWVCVCVG